MSIKPLIPRGAPEIKTAGVTDHLVREPGCKVLTLFHSHPLFSVLRDWPTLDHIPTCVMQGSLEAELEKWILVQWSVFVEGGLKR